MFPRQNHHSTHIRLGRSRAVIQEGTAHAQQCRGWRGAILLGMLLMLAACGGAGRATRTPEQVHRQWVEALRDNNRAAAQDLPAPSIAPYLDKALADIQVELHSPVLGPLQTLDIHTPVQRGQGQVGWSVWTFARREACYATTLALVEGTWRVANWQRRPCQEMPPL